MNSASDEHSKAMVWGSLGATYQKQKKFLKAIECYDKSLEFFFKRETTFAKYIAKIYLAKAKAFIAIGQKDKALKCLDSALKISSSDILTEEINELISDIREN
jgi:tetratricopeptide (TPR) repeat protein